MASAVAEQELRLAVVMTGGVSLAIWMGGVASEIDQVVRSLDLPAGRRTPEQQAYAELLELAKLRPRVDVVSGTSAGGVNGALLAGAVARRRTLDGLRDIWLKVADFSELLRSPFERDQQSLLKGDQYFTPGLQQGIQTLLGDQPVAPDPSDHPVELLITTTLLNGEDSALVDSYGTRIPDVRHHALFKFDREKLMTDPGVVGRLALAARSSASFPIAFEPSWIPCAPDAADDAHPDMKGIADFHANHFVIDGGVLVNRPIEPALRAIFAMPAGDTDVSRVLLYVVPDPGETLATQAEKLDEPFALADVGLKSLVGIPRTQSIASDLERIKEHGARVQAQRNARDFILEHGFEAQLATVPKVLPAYRARRAEREVDWLLGELTRRYRTTMEAALGFDPIKQGDLARDLAVVREATLPTHMLRGEPSAREVGPWGIDSLERAATVTLDLARRGWRRAEPGDARKDLAGARTRVHTALQQLRARRDARRAQLRDKRPDEAFDAWTEAMLALVRSDDDELLSAACDIAQALHDAADAIRRIGGDPVLTMLCDRLTPPNATDGDRLRRLFSLEVIQDAVGLASPVVEQPVALLQVSANTRDGFSSLKTAGEKLTGMRLMHFAAFYKPSWRANDWMWGRIDGVGWLTQLLLDPSRLEAVFRYLPLAERVDALFKEIQRIAVGPAGGHQQWLRHAFERDEDAIRNELAWLKDPDPKVPPALPLSSMAVARRLQLSVLAAELPAIAEAINLDEANDALSQSGRRFRAVWNEVGPQPDADALKRGLLACQFAADGFTEEYDSGLLARTTTGAVATTSSALSGGHSGLPPFIAASKIMTSARGLALALHGVTDAALRRSRMAFAIIIGLAAIAGGALGVAIASEGTQPVLTSFGFAVVFAIWVVGLWRAPKHRRGGWFKRYARYLGLTLAVVIGCAVVSLIPWFIGTLLDPCPKRGDKVTDCFRGDVEAFITGLEPAFVVLALVLGAMVFGWKAVAPPSQDA